jgi:transposase
VRWVWNQSLVTRSQTSKETGKGISALTMKKQIPVWKKEHEWLIFFYSQCLQQSVLNLSQAFINFFDEKAKYPIFKNRQGRQSIQFCSETLLQIPKMDLSVRMFDCPHCRQQHDRDINAAINIRNVREAFPKGRLTDFDVGNQRFCPWRGCKTKAVWT